MNTTLQTIPVAANFNSHAWRKVKLHGSAVAECKACGARLGSQRSKELCKGAA